MLRSLAAALALVLVAPSPLARAQPAGAPSSSAQMRAEALFAAGRKKLGENDVAGALALFQDAQREHPQAKYVLAIGVALEKLGRLVEAADHYEQFVESPDAEPARRDGVRQQLRELDATLGKLLVVVLGPATSEVQVADGPWTGRPARPVRVTAGGYVVRGRYPGRSPVEVTGEVAAGRTIEVTVDLTPRPATPPPAPPPVTPAPPPVTPTVRPPTPVAPPSGTRAEPPVADTSQPPAIERKPSAGPAPVEARASTRAAGPAPAAVTTTDGLAPARPRRSLSLFAGAIGTVTDPGVRGLVGVGYEPFPRLRLGLDVIVGAGPGVAPRASVYLLGGRLRPVLHLGVPVRRLETLDNPMGRPCEVVAVDGSPRVASFIPAVHGGLGLEWQATARLAVVAELGYERYFGVDECITVPGVVTPVLGLMGRL